MSAIDMILLYDYYGDLLTERQRECFELRYYQDLSLGEIGEELGISRQGVHDNLSRAEALLRNMEAKTGCASRDQACRKAAGSILEMGRLLQQMEDPAVSALAEKIISAARGLEE
ncbi:MAG: DNA-binding protein [Ruminococcaceae bacterium]|nr:DNA-binding protein [Oscillospiraceae bacterium]